MLQSYKYQQVLQPTSFTSSDDNSTSKQLAMMHESRVKEEERAAVKSARDVTESVLGSHLGPSAPPLAIAF